jgi:capsid protein
MFDRWLPFAFLSGQINLPLAKFDKFNVPEWKPRRWPWVDPEKDINADIKAVEKGFKSRREIISDAGGDVEDVFNAIASDEALAEKLGLEFPIGQNPQVPMETAPAAGE